MDSVYGLVNQGVKDMVLEAGGEALWQQVRAKAAVDLDEFLSMQAYDDAVTMGLVAAASEVLSTPADTLLEGFGHHWIGFTSKSGYGPLMAVSGDTLEEFLSNLDQMHARIKNSMPNLDPPSFTCEAQPDGAIQVSYYSNREGLVPMVVGLIKGLADKFGQQAEVRILETKATLDDPDILEVRILSDGATQ
ncbi:MAG: heme NO-binding domain-containing protein [Pseudomonadota bacterium]